MSTEFAPTLQFEYKNWLGKVSIRKVVPYDIWFGSTEFHPEDQWFLHVFDMDKGEERNFALRDIIKFL